MTSYIQIVLTNNSPQTQNFYFFQQPIVYSGNDTVYSNSIKSIALGSNASSGSAYVFLISTGYCAGVQQSFALPQPGQISGYTTAIRSIGVAPGAGENPTNDSTTMSLSPLGLSVPISDDSISANFFRIKSPSFDPTLNIYFGGLAVTDVNNITTMSSYVKIEPLQNLDCQPILKFYVQIGSYAAGTVMNFITSSVNAATCDATTGLRTFNISYNANGTWTVTPCVSATVMINTTAH